MLKRAISIVTVTAATAAIAGVALVASPAAQAADRVIQESDRIQITGNVDGDHGNAAHSFGSDGLSVSVAGADGDYVVLRWADGSLLSDVRTVTYDWTGTDARPGIKYDIDISGDGTVDCELVGEAVYGGTDVWLNKDVGDFPGSDGSNQSGSTDNYCAEHGPRQDYGGGSGATEHGSLNDWAAALPDPTGKDASARVIDTGIGASGLAQNGTLTSVTVGTNRYTFATPTTTPTPTPSQSVAAPQRANVTGRFTAKQRAHKVVIALTADALPSGAAAGNNLVWTYTVNKGHKRTVSQAAGGTDTVKVTYFRHAKKAGNHKVVRLYRNGQKVAVYVLIPRPLQHR